ncbi:uncharacterized protein LOC106024916 [Esox lucius]|uniref:uncharacterized protein LOC106024916 n=1 Tax=Esox lucius TaxID=8010 RepID=UPI00147700AD|nr:uncharacterized protein LOC106024916 [Esox lucius]
MAGVTRWLKTCLSGALTERAGQKGKSCRTREKLSDDYEGEEKLGGGIKGVSPSKIKCTSSLISNTYSEQKERRACENTQKGMLDNTPRRKLKRTEPGRSLQEPEALKKQEPSYHPNATSSHRSPGVPQTQAQSLSGEAARVAKVTDQAAWPTDTLQQESPDYKGERGCDREEDGLDREDHPNQPAEPTSAAESSLEVTDVQSDFHDRLDQLVAKPSNKMKPSAQSKKRDLRSKRVGKCAKKQEPFHHPKAVTQDRSASKSNKSSASKSSGSKSDNMAHDSPAHSLHHRYSQDNEHPWLNEAEEVNREEEECHDDEDEIPGEDLAATMDYNNSESPGEYDCSDDFIDDRSTEEEYSKEVEEDDEVFCAQVKRRAKKAMREMKNVNLGHEYKRVSHSESEEDEYCPESACSVMKEDTLGCKRALQSDSDELIKPDVKRVKLTKNSRPDRSEEKCSRSASMVKETSVQRFDREDKTLVKKRQDKSNKRCERVMSAKNTQIPNRDSPLYKTKLSDSETDDYEREEKLGRGIKGVSPSKIKCTSSLISNTYSVQEERRVCENTQKGMLDNTPRRKLKRTEPGRSLQEPEALKKQEPSYHPNATSSHRSPGVPQTQAQSLSGEAARVAKVTDQAAWPTDTLQQESPDYKGEGGCDREEDGLDREDHPNQPAEPTSAAESSQEHSDVQSDFHDRLDQLVTKPSNKMKPSAQSKKSDLRSKRVGKCAKKQEPFHHPKAVTQDRSASKSNKSSASKSSGSKSDNMAHDSPAHSLHHRYSQDNEHPWLNEAEEVNCESEECHEDEDKIPGEDLEDTMDYKNSESPDEYDYSDDFIDDFIRLHITS